MDNQHKQIKGYRDLSQEEIDLMNEIKEHAERTRELLNRIDRHIDAQAIDPDQPHSVVTSPARWLAEGRTDLQKGFMCVIRSIAQPTSF
jgi:hypothetical protein